MLGGAVLLVGCSGTQMQSDVSKSAEMSAKQVSAGQPASGGGMEGMASDEKSQGCSACSTGEEPAPAVGTVQTADGVQVVTVGIVDGYYTPNQFAVKPGMPVRVVFKVEGKPAKACVSKPTFKSLNKTVTVNEGEESLDLGMLEPGTYEFSCAMGANKGTITVQ